MNLDQNLFQFRSGLLVDVGCKLLFVSRPVVALHSLGLYLPETMSPTEWSRRTKTRQQVRSEGQRTGTHRTCGCWMTLHCTTCLSFGAAQLHFPDHDMTLSFQNSRASSPRICFRGTSPTGLSHLIGSLCPMPDEDDRASPAPESATGAPQAPNFM